MHPIHHVSPAFRCQKIQKSRAAAAGRQNVQKNEKFDKFNSRGVVNLIDGGGKEVPSMSGGQKNNFLALPYQISLPTKR
jgi:hypothetical protein